MQHSGYGATFRNTSCTILHLSNHTFLSPTVGAGSAGAVVASRLSEDADKKVLLLEAGGEEDSHPATHVPFLCDTLQKTPVDWQYRTEPQKDACLSLRGQVNALLCSLSKLISNCSNIGHFCTMLQACLCYCHIPC